jgi:hypothetical protein
LDYHCVEHHDIPLTVFTERHMATNTRSVP